RSHTGAGRRGIVERDAALSIAETEHDDQEGREEEAPDRDHDKEGAARLRRRRRAWLRRVEARKLRRVAQASVVRDGSAAAPASLRTEPQELAADVRPRLRHAFERSRGERLELLRVRGGGDRRHVLLDLTLDLLADRPEEGHHPPAHVFLTHR